MCRASVQDADQKLRREAEAERDQHQQAETHEHVRRPWRVADVDGVMRPNARRRA